MQMKSKKGMFYLPEIVRQTWRQDENVLRALEQTGFPLERFLGVPSQYKQGLKHTHTRSFDRFD
jgi:hypothetical protein